MRFALVALAFVWAAFFSCAALAQSLPQGVQRDQAECYQQANMAANMVRGHPNYQSLVTNLYYGCMKQKGYAVPDQQVQQPTQQPAAPQPMRQQPVQQPQGNYQQNSGAVAEDANAQANEFMLLLDPKLYTKD